MPITLGILAQSRQAAVQGDFVLLGTAFGTGSSPTIEFTSVPSEYRHLQVRFSGKQTSSGEFESWVRFNGDSTAGNYTGIHQLYGYNSSMIGAQDVGVTNRALTFYVNGTADGDSFAAGILDILDYRSTTKNKALRMFTGLRGNNGFIALRSSLYRPATPVAITSMSFTTDSGNWDSKTRISLYGIRG